MKRQPDLLFQHRLFHHREKALATALAVSLCAGALCGQQLASPASQRQREAAWEKGLFDSGTTATMARLQQTLEEADDDAKVRAMAILGEVEAKSAVPRLLALLSSTKETRIVLVTCHTLGRMGDPRALPMLAEWASNPDETQDRRRAAIIALGLLGEQSVVPVLERVATEDDQLLRVFAAGSLGMLGKQTGIEAALAGLNSTNASLRRHSIQALGFIGGKLAAATLHELARKSLPKVERDSIELALLQIEVEGEQPRERLDHIKAGVSKETRNSQLVAWGLRELVRAGVEGSVALRELSTGHPSESVRKQAERARNISDLRSRIQREDK